MSPSRSFNQRNLSRTSRLPTLWVFRSRQLNPLFRPKAAITGPADHLIIKKNRVEVQITINTELNNKIVYFVRKKQFTVKKNRSCYFDVPFAVITKQNFSKCCPYLVAVSLSPRSVNALRYFLSSARGNNRDVREFGHLRIWCKVLFTGAPSCFDLNSATILQLCRFSAKTEFM